MLAFELLLNSVRASFVWATQVFEKSGMMSYLLGIIIITIVFDKIISPMMRGRGSDRADRRRNRKDSGSENG